MPTPPLPVLQALLTALDIPVYPPTLASVPPTLLLLVLESLIGRRIPLPRALRLPDTRDDEIELAKCVLGVLSDDVLSLDLTVIDPVRVVGGSEPDIAAVVLALAVVARRRGVDIRLPTPVDEDECDISWESMDASLLDADDGGADITVPPLQPLRFSTSSPSWPSNLSASSKPPTTRAAEFTDGFTTPPPVAPRRAEHKIPSPIYSLSPPARPRHTPSPLSSGSDGRGYAVHRRTILQSMVEEFGLKPG